MISRIFISNYKRFRRFETALNPDLNIVVGDNEAGKSTLLEALNLALSRRLNGRSLDQELSPYLFNDECRDAYVRDVQAGRAHPPPSISIEAYFAPDESLAQLRGTNNSRGEDCPGLRLEIVFDDAFSAEYAKLLEEPSAITTVPIEYYRVDWFSFANEIVTARNQPVRAS